MPYTGITATIPGGAGGFNPVDNPAIVPMTDLLEAENVIIEDGTWHKLHGVMAWAVDLPGTPPNNCVDSLMEWHPTLDTQCMASACRTGYLYKSDEATGDLGYTCLNTVSPVTTTQRSQWIVAGQETAGNPPILVFVNGYNSPGVVQGTEDTMYAMENPSTDWSGTGYGPVSGLIHRGRLVGVGGKNAPHRIWFSLASDHEDFTTTPTTVDIGPGIGRRLVAGVSFQGRLFLWKWPRGIFWLDDSDPTPANWVVHQKTRALGCAFTPNAVLPIDDDVMFLSPDGTFHLLSAITGDELSGVRASSISNALNLDDWIKANIDLTKLNYVSSVWYPGRRLALWGF